MSKDPVTAPFEKEIPLDVGRSGAHAAERSVAAEVPVALTYNGLPHVVMMMTPVDIEDFVVGFSLSEGIIDQASDISGLNIRAVAPGFLVSSEIPDEMFARVKGRRRNLPGQSGCGICGVVELENAIRPVEKVVGTIDCSVDAVFLALGAMRARQELNLETGAMHGAAFVSAAGEIIALREDVGRHNALDKLIGSMARVEQSMVDGFVLLSSRCSVELVQKAIAVDVPMLVTVSAPTGLALDLARQAGLTLICVARGDGFLVYHDPHEIFGQRT